MREIDEKILMRQVFSSFLGIVIFLIAALFLWNPAIAPTRLPLDSAKILNEIDQTRRGTFFDIAKTSRTVVAVGDHGRIYYSFNEGKSWTKAKTPTDLALTSLYLLDEQNGWAVGYDGVILKTTDGGISWDIVRKPSFASPALFAVWFNNEKLGLAVGADSVIYHTFDGGLTWDLQKLDIQAHLYGLSKTQDGTLWLAGENKALYWSNDLGITWKKLQPEFLTSFFKTLPLKNQLITLGLRGRIALWDTNKIVKSTIESDENLLGGCQLHDGRVILAGQRGRLLIGQINPWLFHPFKISPTKDISSLIEVTDALIFVGEFGITRIAKSDLGL